MAVTINASTSSGLQITSDTSGDIAFQTNGTQYNPTLVRGTVNAGGTNPFNNTLTAVDFTSIPSWVKRITVMFSGVSTSGTSAIQIQLGDSGGVENTGYLSSSSTAGGTVSAITSGFAICTPAATSVVSGHCVITLIDSANTWIQTSLVKSATNTMAYGAGDKATSSTLDRIRITTVNGTDTFDAGSINIMYE